MLRPVLFALAAASMAACTPTQTADGTAEDRDCFRNADIFGYSVVDDHTIRVDAGARDYLLITNWNARDLDWTTRIAIEARPTGWICTGSGVGVEIIGGDPVRRYPVNEVRRAPEEPAPSGS